MDLRDKLKFWIMLSNYVDMIVRGTSPLSLPDAIADSLSYVKAFGGTEHETEIIIQTATAQGKTEQRNIPDNYLQRQYIYMMNRSYLLTDIVPTYDGRVEMDFQTTTVPSGAMTYVGGRTASHPAGLRFGTDSDKNWTVGAFGGAYVGVTNPSNNTRYKFVYNDQRISLTSNGTTIFNAKLTGTSATGAELAINALNNNGAITSYNEGIYLYSFKVWNAQGELIADYVPAVQKGTVPVVGFYDTVSGTFKTATAGTFAAGAEAVPTPDAPMDIVSNNGVLKLNNVHNIATDTLGGYINKSTGAIVSNAGYGHTDYIPVTAGQVFKITQRGSSTTDADGVAQYNSNKVWQSGQSINALGGTYTIPSGISYIRLNFNITYQQFIIEDGIYADGTVETITDNIGNVATCERLLQVSTYTDTQEILSGVVTRNVGVKVLDGTEDWVQSSAQNDVYRLTETTAKREQMAIYATHFVGTSEADVNMPDNSIKLGSYAAVPGYGVLAIRLSNVTTLSQFTQFLADQYNAGTPVIICYPLATATTESVTGQNLRKEPLTIAGSLSNLLVNTTTTDAVPTPEYPLDIVSNNGVLKARHQSGLPLGYTLLNYIGSSGTQWIDTGYMPNANTKIRIHGKQGTTDCALFGVSLIFYCFSNNPNTLHYNLTGSSGTLAFNLQGVDATIVLSAIDGLVVNGTQLATVTAGSSTASYTMALFGRIDNTNGTIAKLGSHRIYSCELWDNGVLVRNFVPCKNASNVVGMYDTVNGVFYQNAGTGTFTAGNTVSDPVEIYTDGTVETIGIRTRNLFDINTATRYRCSITGSADEISRVSAVSSTSTAQTYAMAVKPNTTYTISKVGGNRLAVAGFRTPTYPSNTDITTVPYTYNGVYEITTGSVTFTTDSDCVWIIFSPRNNTIVFDEATDIQVEQGSTATPYQPYYDGGTAIAEMLLKVGDYEDVQEILSGAITRNVGVKVLDGTENWRKTSSSSKYCSLTKTDATGFPNAITTTSDVICTHAIGTGYNAQGYCSFGISNFNFNYKNTTDDLDDFKQYLADQYAAGTPVTVIYPLAQAVTEQVAPQVLNVQTGDNILEITQASLSNLELEAKYQKSA